MSDDLEFEIVGKGTPHEDAAFLIQEQYKKFFFVPEPAFRHAVANGLLLGAFREAVLVGYIWSTRKDGILRVRYLAVHGKEARKGIGRRLVDELKRRNDNAFRIQLSCRTDYPGWKFWKGVGFRALGNRPGRSKAGSEVTDFEFKISPFPLFSKLAAVDERPMVAIDANVFYDLRDDQRPHYPESSGLLADWIEADFDLCVTAAPNEDVARRDDDDDETACDHDWQVIEADKGAFDCILQQLISLIGPGETPQDISDRNHLSHSIAENVHAFVTRDEYLLENADNIYDQFGTSVMRPVEFVVNVDATSNQLRFDRKDLSSVRFSVSGSMQDDQDTSKLASLCRTGEKASTLMAKLRGWRANPDRFEVLSILDSDSSTQAMAAIETIGSRAVVHLLRASVQLRGKRRGQTMLRCLVAQLRSRFSDSVLIEVTDEIGVAESSEALNELGFSFHDRNAYKICLPGVWEVQDAVEAANGLVAENDGPTQLMLNLEKVGSMTDPMTYLRLEHRLWPAKLISGDCVSCLAIPIRPNWARSLFDPNLGQSEFWDEDANLLLNPTNAYYTGARPAQQQGRILWYVSSSDNFSGTKRIRACSQMTRRVIAPPLQSYRQFRHFGVYRFQDVEKLSSPNRPDVMAIEFRDTELFSDVMTLPVIREILESPNEAFQWPIKVEESKFLEIYRQGTA